jgi:hypothetical protein
VCLSRRRQATPWTAAYDCLRDLRDRETSADDGTGAGGRDDRYLPPDRGQSIGHSAQPRAEGGRLRVEADPVVRHLEPSLPTTKVRVKGLWTMPEVW